MTLQSAVETILTEPKQNIQPNLQAAVLGSVVTPQNTTVVDAPLEVQVLSFEVPELGTDEFWAYHQNREKLDKAKEKVDEWNQQIAAVKDKANLYKAYANTNYEIIIVERKTGKVVVTLGEGDSKKAIELLKESLS